MPLGLNVPDELVPQNGGSFGVMRDAYLIGGWRVVADTAARDSIPALRRVVGMRVRTASDGREWVLDADLSSWTEAAGGGGTGNPALLSQLNTSASVVRLYCSPSGNDVTGNGSFANPFRFPQRACDEIPCSQAAGTPIGFVQIICLAGAYPKDCVLGVKSAPNLWVLVSGDDSVQDATYMLPGGVRPKLTTAPARDKCHQWNYDVGPLGFAITNGSHWADQPYDFGGGVFFSNAIAAVNAERSGGSTLSLAESYDPSLNGTPLHVRPVVSSIDIRGTGQVQLFLGNENISGTKLIFSGLLVASDFSTVVTNAQTYGCVFAGVTDQTNLNFNHNTFLSQGNMVQDTVAQCVVQDGNNAGLAGIFDCNTVIEGPSSEFFIGGVYRGRDGNGVALYLGGPTGGRIGSATDIELEGMDLEGTGWVQIQGASTRWGNHAPVSVDGALNWIIARFGARTHVQTVYGTTTAECCIFEAGTHCFGVLSGRSGSLINTGTLGAEVLIRKDGLTAGVTHAFTDLPVTDTILLVRVE